MSANADICHYCGGIQNNAQSVGVERLALSGMKKRAYQKGYMAKYMSEARRKDPEASRKYMREYMKSRRMQKKMESEEKAEASKRLEDAVLAELAAKSGPPKLRLLKAKPGYGYAGTLKPEGI